MGADIEPALVYVRSRPNSGHLRLSRNNSAWAAGHLYFQESEFFSLTFLPIRIIRRSPCAPMRGRNAIVTSRWRGLRWTLWRQVLAPDENVRSVRRSRVVLAPRPWRLSAPPVRERQRWQ